MGTTLLWAAFPLGPGPGWRVGLGTQGRKVNRDWGPPGKEVSLGKVPLHHWPRWSYGSVSEEDVDRGLVTSSQLLWPLSSRDRHCPGLGWLLLAMHTPGGPAHSRGDFGFCCRGHKACTKQESLAWPSVPGGQRFPRASWGGDIQPRVAPFSSGLLQLLGPSQQCHPCPRRRPAGRKELSAMQSCDLCVLPCPGC